MLPPGARTAPVGFGLPLLEALELSPVAVGTRLGVAEALPVPAASAAVPGVACLIQPLISSFNLYYNSQRSSRGRSCAPITAGMILRTFELFMSVGFIQI